MTRKLSILALLATFMGCNGVEPETSVEALPIEEKPDFVLVIHGGAGNLHKLELSPAEEAEYKYEMGLALDSAAALLRAGGSSLDAVELAVRILEDCPLFNAGKGSVFTSEGINEMDAAIMNGATLEAGAVTGIQEIRHPVTAARKVMEASPHVMFSGKGATDFAIEQGLEQVDSTWFFTPNRWEQYLRAKEQATQQASISEDLKYGTVGAVALDLHGNLAAATSTGGMTYKRNGRIGDAPVIGAGTYADNRGCAVSCTGHGEYFIRAAVAHDLNARVRYTDQGLQSAAEFILHEELSSLGGFGGLIAVEADGTWTWAFSTAGMFRGAADSKGYRALEIY